MVNFSDKISREQAREALQRSGYILESRLETVLRNEGYYVEANTAYPDPDTGTSRELDLYALTARQGGPDELDLIVPVLLIECVNNPQPIAFITKDPIAEFLHLDAVKLSGLPLKVPVEGERDTWESLPDYLGMEKYHHYCKGRIATQFCSFKEKKSGRKKKSQEWMALHEDAHFDCFRKLTAVIEHYMDEHFKGWSFAGHEPVNIQFYYPGVVVQGDLLDIRPSRRSFRILRTNHIQYRRTAFVGNEEASYQIDVIKESYFPKYLEMIEEEVSKTSRLMRRRHKVLRNAIDMISRRSKRLRSPEKIRANMEF